MESRVAMRCTALFVRDESVQFLPKGYSATSYYTVGFYFGWR